MLEAARPLFADAGYAQVSMAQIAAAVNVSAAALYRHFDSKRALLAAVIAEGLEHVTARLEATTAADDPATLADALTAAVLDRRQLGVLWQREARMLDAATRVRLAGRLRRLADVVSVRVAAIRPELSAEKTRILAWPMLSVLASAAYHRVADPIVVARLPRALLAVVHGPPLDGPPLGSPPLDGGPVGRPDGGLVAHARREQVLSTATGLFAERGFAAVTLEDIGGSLGIAGPSLYSHFPDKETILLAALERGAHRLQSDLAWVLRSSSTPADALAEAVRSYARFALEDPALVTVLVSETGSLAAEHRRRVRQMQRAYVDEWVALLGGVEEGRSAEESRVHVHAALTLLNDVARSAGRLTAGGQETLVDVTLRVLLAR